MNRLEARATHPKKTGKGVQVGANLEKRLLAYAAAASAAGVATLAMVPPAEGKIVYTRVHQQISPNTMYNLDLNHDGATDFTLGNHSSVRTSVSDAIVNIILPAGNAVRGYSIYASALPMGVKIQAGKKFLSGMYSAEMAGSAYATWRGSNHGGPWFDVKNRFLGLRFAIKGKMHYGWARLNVSCAKRHCSALLTGYAYETIPGKPIITGATKGPDGAEPTASLNTRTPEPPTLGMLALGAPAACTRKRHKTS
jgi:hypothetical protein